ncbi:MAG: hypothetical protein M1834_005857 [Cirrosporium novae-zelandiae]|nr:MAG: hypothetical protein M1834_005857 [Cirrosporium novae-zelandiae]
MLTLQAKVIALSPTQTPVFGNKSTTPDPTPSLCSSQASSSYNFTAIDFEIYHHYIGHTSSTLGPGYPQIWRDIIPPIAFDHPFLLHGILAITALHLIYLHPEKEHDYLIPAISHQDIALQGYRIALADVSPYNCHAIFAFSTLLIQHAFSAPRAPGNLIFTGSHENEVVPCMKWLPLLNGSRSVVECSTECLRSGPLAPFLLADKWKMFYQPITHLDPRAQEEDRQLSKLAQMWQAGTPLYGTAEADVYVQCLDQLRLSFAHGTRDGGNTAEFLMVGFSSWCIRIPDEYFKLLDQQKEGALVILAHYFVLADKLKGYWWVDGMAKDLIGKIHAMLNEEWWHWIEWPMKMVKIN